MSALKEVVAKVSRLPRVRKQAMELTESAAARIKELLVKREKPYLKIGVRTRGCNGMTYTMVGLAAIFSCHPVIVVRRHTGVKTGGVVHVINLGAPPGQP
jgi:hypothetical protein